MSSGYFVSDDAWWVSNGSAELLNESWARHIRTRGNADAPGVAELLAQLDRLVEMSASGMLGFDFDKDVRSEARPVLCTAIADFAHEFVAAIHGEVRHESLSFVARLEQPTIAWWVATHVALYELIMVAMGEKRMPDLDLGLAHDLAGAACGYRYAGRIPRFKHALDPLRERAHRRAQVEAWRSAGDWVSLRERTSALCELADLEERLGNHETSAALTEEAAALDAALAPAASRRTP